MACSHTIGSISEPRVSVFFNDMLLTGSDKAKHLSMLDKILRRNQPVTSCYTLFLQDNVECLVDNINV